jgi:toxin HigB-1
MGEYDSTTIKQCFAYLVNDYLVIATMKKTRVLASRKGFLRYMQHVMISILIKSLRHKGLRKFFDSGTTTGIPAIHVNRLRMQLAALDTARSIDDMDIPGFRLHPLKGRLRDPWSVSVSGNWRLTFEFLDGNAYILDYEDYH